VTSGLCITQYEMLTEIQQPVRKTLKPYQGCLSASLAVMRLAGSSVRRRLSRSKPASERPQRVSRALGAGNLVRSRLYGCCGNLICSRTDQGSDFRLQERRETSASMQGMGMSVGTLCCKAASRGCPPFRGHIYNANFGTPTPSPNDVAGFVAAAQPG
jgi:hypothetical protein